MELEWCFTRPASPIERPFGPETSNGPEYAKTMNMSEDVKCILVGRYELRRREGTGMCGRVPKPAMAYAKTINVRRYKFRGRVPKCAGGCRNVREGAETSNDIR